MVSEGGGHRNRLSPPFRSLPNHWSTWIRDLSLSGHALYNDDLIAPLRWHHKLETASMPPPLRRPDEESWAKCDMVVSVAFNRLNLVRTERIEGKRRFAAHYVISEDLRAIQACLLFVLNMANLIPRLE
jgi:hypothetical protein